MILRRAFVLLASLRLAVIVLLALSFAMAWGTILEAQSGSEAARRLVYAASWFDGLLVLLAANVLCAALKRYPWRRRHVGFLITHAAILIILAGTFLTRHFGVEGTITLAEGEAASAFSVDEDALVIEHQGSGKSWEFLPGFGLSRVMNLNWDESEAIKELRLQVKEIIPHALPVESVSGGGETFNPAVAVEVPEQDHPSWIFANDPDKNRIVLGVVSVALQVCSTSEEIRPYLNPEETPSQGYPHGVVEITDSGGQQTILNVDPAQDEKPVPLGESGWTAHIAEYLPDAVVSGGRLISRSERPENPAVRLIFTSPQGVTEERKLFARFPEFSSMHRQATSSIPVEALYRFEQDSDSSVIRLLVLPGETLYVVVPDDQGTPSLQSVTVGQMIPVAGDERRGIRVRAFHPRAQKVTEWISSPWEGDPPALRLTLGQGSEESSGWVGYGADPLLLTLCEEFFSLRLSQREVPLGFQIRLLEFGNPTYGGTGMAARYYSTVDVSPTDKSDLVEKHTISMNQPLVMNGFRLFQSSYYQDPDGTSVSVLSVSRDPGVPLVYSGSCLLIVGIALTFYLPRQRTGAAQNG